MVKRALDGSKPAVQPPRADPFRKRGRRLVQAALDRRSVLPRAALPRLQAGGARKAVPRAGSFCVLSLRSRCETVIRWGDDCGSRKVVEKMYCPMCGKEMQTGYCRRER